MFCSIGQVFNNKYAPHGNYYDVMESPSSGQSDKGQFDSDLKGTSIAFVVASFDQRNSSGAKSFFDCHNTRKKRQEQWTGRHQREGRENGNLSWTSGALNGCPMDNELEIASRSGSNYAPPRPLSSKHSSRGGGGGRMVQECAHWG